MNTSVQSEIYSASLDKRFDVVISEMKNMRIITSVPQRKGNDITFPSEELLTVSYFFGHFKYSFDVHYLESIEKNGVKQYVFAIVKADIDNNFRKEMRKNVEFRAVYWTKEGISFAMILDISPSGLRIQTDKPFKDRTMELYFNEKDFNGTKKIKGTIIWEKKVKNKYEYGLSLQ